MTRLLLAFTVWSYVITPIALSAGGPENRTPALPAPANAPPVYVKIIMPVDPAAPAIEKDRPVIESWISKSIENRHKANFRAVTAWVPLVEEEPDEGMILWYGAGSVCPVSEDITERKDGWIKISFQGWTPFGSQTTVTLKDEPGSREVVAVTQAERKHGVPHVAGRLHGDLPAK